MILAQLLAELEHAHAELAAASCPTYLGLPR
jgi:hypothetical protein